MIYGGGGEIRGGSSSPFGTIRTFKGKLALRWIPFLRLLARMSQMWLVGVLVNQRSALLPSARRQSSPSRASPMPRRSFT